MQKPADGIVYKGGYWHMNIIRGGEGRERRRTLHRHIGIGDNETKGIGIVNLHVASA